MARQRELRLGKARRTTPLVRRHRVTIAERLRREATYSDPDRMTDAQVDARNRAMAAALGRPGSDRAALASYAAAAQRHSKALARKRRRPRRATTLKSSTTRKKTTGKRRAGVWVYVKAHRRHRPS